MGLFDILKANRDSGNWVPGVEGCINRVLPCGNPYCADEAMRSGNIRESSPQGSEQAHKHAHKIATECSGCATCPLNREGNIHSTLNSLARR